MEMPSFYLIAVVITVIVLILCLTGVGIMMKYQNAGISFPPSSQPCPDGWTVDASGYCGTVVSPETLNTGRLYAVTGDDISLNSPYNSYTIVSRTSGTSYVSSAKLLDTDLSINFNLPGKVWTTCQQKNWANKYGISWDGISNYNGTC